MPRWRRGIKAGDYYPKRPLTTTSHLTVTRRTVGDLRNIHFPLVDCTQRIMLREEVELLTTGAGPRAPLRFDSGELELWLRSNHASPVSDDGLRQEQLRAGTASAERRETPASRPVDLAGARGP